ncbi:MAG: hypothetical protein AB2A00_37280 [Myxococcota bacterium]
MRPLLLTSSAAGGRPWALILLLVLLPLWNHPYFEELKSPNPLVRTYLTRALVDHHTVVLDKVEAEHGWVMDRAVREGHLYCDKAPGSSFLLVPVYAVMKALSSSGKVETQKLLAWGSVLLGVLPTFLALACLDSLLVLLMVTRAARRVALIAWGLGSVGVPFELLFFGHQLAACLVVFALWAAVHAARKSSFSWAMLAGFAGGWAAITEYPTTLLIGMVGLLGAGMAWRDSGGAPRAVVRLLLGMLVGSLVPLGLGMAYHQAAFGGPLTTGYAFIENPYFRSVHKKGLMGVSLPTLEGLGGTLFSPARGLFYFQPYLLLWPVGCVLLMRSRRAVEGWVLLLAGLLYISFAAGFGYWLGGWSLGPRHLVPAVPLFTLGFAVALHTLETTEKSPWPVLGAAVRGGVVWSVVVVGLACATHSGYPEELMHPFFQMTLPLLTAGLFPYSVGTLLGWKGFASAVVPLTALVLSALWAVFVGRAVTLGRASSLGRSAVTLWTAAALVLGMGLLVRATPEATHRLAWIIDTVWEPREGPKRPDPVKQAPGFSSRPVRQDERNHVGRHHARINEPARALEEYVRGVVAAEAGRP